MSGWNVRRSDGTWLPNMNDTGRWVGSREMAEGVSLGTDWEIFPDGYEDGGWKARALRAEACIGRFDFDPYKGFHRLCECKWTHADDCELAAILKAAKESGE